MSGDNVDMPDETEEDDPAEVFMARETVSFDEVVAIKETDASLLCVIEGKKVWIPKSQIDDDSEVYKDGHEGTLVISEWIATERGLV